MNTKIYRPSHHTFNVFSKYIDKVNFERKNLPEIFLNREKFISDNESRPKISFQLAHNQISSDVHRTIFDVEINYTINGADSSTNEKKEYEVYSLKIIYIALTNIENSSSISELELKQILLVDIPYLTFPHIERFVFDFLKDSGSAPLQITPVDWISLFEREGVKTHDNMN
jgi:preprotein translocase subunit SecB